MIESFEGWTGAADVLPAMLNPVHPSYVGKVIVSGRSARTTGEERGLRQPPRGRASIYANHCGEPARDGSSLRDWNNMVDSFVSTVLNRSCVGLNGDLPNRALRTRRHRPGGMDELGVSQSATVRVLRICDERRRRQNPHSCRPTLSCADFSPDQIGALVSNSG